MTGFYGILGINKTEVIERFIGWFARSMLFQMKVEVYYLVLLLIRQEGERIMKHIDK